MYYYQGNYNMAPASTRSSDQLFRPSGAGIDVRRQNLTSKVDAPYSTNPLSAKHDYSPFNPFN